MSGVATLAEFGSVDIDLYRAYLVVNYAVAVRFPGGSGGAPFPLGGVRAVAGSRGGQLSAAVGDASGESEGGGEKRIRDAGGCSGGVPGGCTGTGLRRDGSDGDRDSALVRGADTGLVDGDSVLSCSVVEERAEAVVGTGNLKPELVSGIQDGDVVPVSGVRGPNWARNRVAREKRKRQKKARAGCSVSGVEQGFVGSVGREYSSSTVGAVSGRASAVRDSTRADQEGFWNSCSADVRQELIDSKARMHIAENLRKAKKAEEEVKQMESPEALLVRAMGMVSMAERCAKKKNDSKVAGWAETVATSYAESIAKSAPSSVPSYASVLSGSSATSVSVDGTKRKKPQVPVKEREPSVGQIVASYGARLAESRTLADLDGILTDVVDEPKISGGNMNKILNVLEEKRRKFQRVAERVGA